MNDIRALYKELDDSAVVHRTPCGAGHMLWREWGKGEPIVMLHGGSGSWRHWLANISPLAQRYRVLVADLPGLGDSDMPPDGFDHDDLIGAARKVAEIVHAGILTLTSDAVRMLGFSAGSIIGAQLAAAHPTQVRSMHLAGASSLGLSWGGLAGRLRPMSKDMSRDEKLAVQGYNAGLIMLSKAAPADSIEAELQLANTELARLRTHPLASGGVLLDALARLQCPVHAIWGSCDPYALPDIDARVALFRRYFPHGDFQILDGAGHWVMYERAQVFNPAVLAQMQSS
jgi:pimeloyl-ACP methyl ester carboxylesterase